MAALTARIASNSLVQHLAPLVFVVAGLAIAIVPFSLHVLLNLPSYILHPNAKTFKTLQQKLFYYAWRVMSPMLDPGDRPNKEPLLRKAYGVVLEIGAGVGDNIKYYERRKITKLVLVEPNNDMHDALRSKAQAAGYRESDDSLLLLGCGAAATDEAALAAAGVTPRSIDTVAAIHVLCGIPGPKEAIELYRRLLKPGGLLIFYEHVRSEDQGTIRWQNAYTRYIWRTIFDGCELDRATGDWIVLGEGAVANGSTSALSLVQDSPAKRTRSGASSVSKGRWKDFEISAPERQQPFTCMPHVKGFAVKA